VSEQPVSNAVGDFERYLDAALSVGRDWLDALSPDEARRTGVVAMLVLFADWKQGNRTIAQCADLEGDLRSMLCHNCAELHPGLAVLCRRKPIDSCWLLKGYRCRVAEAFVPPRNQ
jgi:hypothetical protein